MASWHPLHQLALHGVELDDTPFQPCAGLILVSSLSVYIPKQLYFQQAKPGLDTGCLSLLNFGPVFGLPASVTATIAAVTQYAAAGGLASLKGLENSLNGQAALH
jgi:hypothetical protein